MLWPTEVDFAFILLADFLIFMAGACMGFLLMQRKVRHAHQAGMKTGDFHGFIRGYRRGYYEGIFTVYAAFVKRASEPDVSHPDHSQTVH